VSEHGHPEHSGEHDIPLTFGRYFLTGLSALLPLWLTAYILWFLIRMMGNLIFPVVRPWLQGILDSPPPEPLLLSVAAVIVMFLIWGLGYLIVHIVGHGHFERIEALIQRIPVVKTIHGIFRRLVDIFLSSKGKFQRVVRVEFPIAGQYTIGFVTRDEPLLDEDSGKDLVPVLVPTAPNPTSGFLLLVPSDRVVYLDVPLDDAMTLLFSAGTFGPTSLPKPTRLPE